MTGGHNAKSMQFDFLDPTSNMRVNTGREFNLSLKGLDDREIPGIDVVASAMSLLTNKAQKVSLTVQETNVHVVVVERVSHSIFNVQEMSHGQIAQIIPARIWINEVPVTGYKATRDGQEIPIDRRAHV